MIGKVTRGHDVGVLLRYLYGPGLAGEHADPHLVASWRGDTRDVLDRLEPGARATGRLDVADLAGRLTLPLERTDPPPRPVWQCSMRVAPVDRYLADTEWAGVAREVVERVGCARAGDPGGCRWVAVRHADHHIHVAVVLARQDGDRLRLSWDWRSVHRAAQDLEQRLGLYRAPVPDRSAPAACTRAEAEKAARTGAGEPARRWLAREVRTAAAGSASREGFAAALDRAGVAVHWRRADDAPDRLVGYAAGRRGDVDARGRQIYFSGYRLAPDLSLPRLESRWAEIDGPARIDRARDARPAVLDRAAVALARTAAEPLTPAVAISTAEVATVLARAVEGPDGGPLTRAADHLAEAARQPRGLRPDTRGSLHLLREVATDLQGLGRLTAEEHDRARVLVGQLARTAHTLSTEGGPRAALYAGRAAVQLAGPLGPLAGPLGPLAEGPPLAPPSIRPVRGPVRPPTLRRG